MADIDFDLPATIFVRQETDLPSEGEYDPREFETTAAAIKYAVEELGPEKDFYISAVTERIDKHRVMHAYDDARFPLERRRRGPT